jgi:pyruvate carboxylase
MGEVAGLQMEMILSSPLTGVVKEVYVKKGDRVDGGNLLIATRRQQGAPAALSCRSGD